MWRDMNDAQHMWVIGSFFHFSAGESWQELRGYDLTPAGSQGLLNNLRCQRQLWRLRLSFRGRFVLLAS
jgi:hypothetical protein